ncbi:MAG: hypothetical protein BMS9Abin05_2310 [Rhodothermia bacterium]|nr:MAG: hypothetical protein BMS9Abin05_2310 [Rhodothermia bacterium]
MHPASKEVKVMKKVTTYITLVLVLALAYTINSSAQKLDIGLRSSVTYQSLAQSNDDHSLTELASGFQTALGNLTGDYRLFDGGRVYLAMFISSKHHTEMWGSEGYFEMSKLPGWMEVGSFGDFFDDHVTLKAGQMTIDYGDGLLYRSINGDVYNNELIGNPVPSPALTSIGIEAQVSAGITNFKVGITNGTTKGDLNKGHGTALLGKTWITPLKGNLRLAASYYAVNHSKNATGYPHGGTKSYLYAFGDRAGSMYNIWSGADGGQVKFGSGQDVNAFQFDARYTFGNALIYAAYGQFSDGDTNGVIDGEDNGNPEERWNYAMVTGKYNFTDWLYVAGRYSTASFTMSKSESVDGTVSRVQLGGGFILSEGILLKAEYVKQTSADFGEGFVNNGVDLGMSPEFSGLVVQTAVSF